MKEPKNDEQNDNRTADELLDELEGETTITVRCQAGANDWLPECDGWEDEIELEDEPEIKDGRLYLPGYSPECPKCGNPHDFEMNGVEVRWNV